MKVNLDYSNLIKENVGSTHGLAIAELEQMQTAGKEAHAALEQKINNNTLGFYTLPDNTDLVDEINSYAETVRERFSHYVHIGIGGSALGPIALQSALNNQFYNDKHSPKMYFPDNVDPDWLQELAEHVDIKNTLFHVVSKSGGTAETAATILYFMDFIQKELGEQFYKNLLFTTDPHAGLLNQIASENAIRCFRIPQNVGGRFSVLTAVGLIPAAIAGIDIAALLNGASQMAKQCRNKEVMKNPAFIYAATHVKLMETGKNISVMMPYSNKLKDIADWYSQLWAESLGKRFNNQGDVIEVGQTPVKALGATDQHSQVQLYIEGPNDKVITFMEVESFKNKNTLKNHFPYINDFNYLQGATLGGLLNSEKQATEIALTNNHRPNLTLKLGSVSPENVGALIFLFQAATAFAGELLNINAFDQPGVEEGKIATYALMGRKGYEKRRKEIEDTAQKKTSYII